MTFLTQLTIAQGLKGLKKKEFTATELVSAHVTATEKLRGLNCYITETPDMVLAAAKASDARYAAGNPLPLDGIPLANKDLFCSKGTRTTAASKILENFVPTYESTVGQNLLNAGVAFLGKTNLDEFAMGSANITSAYGYVENPWKRTGEPNVKLVPGGSSGGSAAIVAARGAMGATGTDTGGSIRQPASFTGLVGLKPTYGRCSRWGVVAFASSLDQPGPFARTVEDCALLLNYMAGTDPLDSTSARIETPDFTQYLGQDLKGMRIGIPKEYRPNGLNTEIAALWDQGAKWLRDAGAEMVDVSLPHTEYALPTYYIIAPAECSSNLARYDGMRYGLRAPGKDLTEVYENTRAQGFGHEVKRRIMIGTYVLSAGYYDAYYRKAQRVRALIARDFDEAFKMCDVLLTPTAPSTAFGWEEKPTDPVEMYLNDAFTIPASMAGLPAMSVPAGLAKNGLPLGLQLIGRAFDEVTMLRAASALETAAQFTATPTIMAA